MTTRDAARRAAKRLRDHPGTAPEEAAAAQAGLERLDAADADPAQPKRRPPKRRVSGVVTTSACQFPDPYRDSMGMGHEFTYVRYTRPRKFCLDHEKGWRDEDGRKRGDTRRLRKNDDGSYSLIVEEVHSDAAVHAMLRAAGYGATGGVGIVSTRVDPKTYRAIKSKGTVEPHFKGARSLDEAHAETGRTLADALAALPDPEHADEYAHRPSEALRIAFASVALAFPNALRDHLPVVVRGWLNDPILTAQVHRDVSILIEQTLALQKGSRETPVLSSGRSRARQ